MKLCPKTSRTLYRILVLGITLYCSSCGPDDNSSLSVAEGDAVQISPTTTDTIVYVVVENTKVPIYLSIPKDCGNTSFPAVVLLHGSGGMWKNDDIDGGIMSSQNREWREIFDNNCIVGAYVDSYTPVGATTKSGKWDTPPETFALSTQFIRPRHAIAALTLLRNLQFSDGTKIVRSKDIAALGFSDGAGAVAATLYDSNSTPSNWDWTQKFDDIEYTISTGVKAPPKIPADGGYAGGVFYYGGSFGHGYWGGNPCGSDAIEDNIYEVYAPVLYQIPADGYLTENTLCMVDLLMDKGNPVELNLYENVGHGFDTDGLEQSSNARTSTINWLKKILHME